jgi:dienelactone hydrolase
MRCLALFTAVNALLAAAAVAEPIPQGSGRQSVQFGSTEMVVFTFRPQCHASSLLLVFHGNAGVPRYRDYARPIADRNCMVVVASRFDRDRFPSASYQRGGIVRRGEVRDAQDWTVSLVPRIADWARRQTGLNDYYLVGHSAGAQFLSRVAAFVPTQARRIVIANPSTHVVPSLDVAAPYGLALVYSRSKAEAALRRYLAQPVTIFLGDEDIGEDDDDLSRNPAAMAQGKTRLERGLRVFHAGERMAASRDWRFNWRLVRAPGIGHAGRRMFASEQMREALRP